MRGRTTLILVALLGALTAYIYLVENKRPDPTLAETKAKVFAVEVDKIEELTIDSTKGDETVLKKSGTAWQLVQPFSSSADASEVTSITGSLAGLEIQRVVEEKASDLKQYGLDPPRIELAFRRAGDSHVQRIQIGDKTATGGDMYARLPGVKEERKVFLIPGYLENTFDRSTFDLRDKTVLAFPREKIDSIEVTAPSQSLTLVKSGEEWRLASPVTAPADFGAVEGLAGKLHTVQMKSIVEPDTTDLKKYGLDAPIATAIVGAGSARATLMLGTSAGEDTVHARDASRPMVFTVEKTLLDELKKGPSDYRRKDLFEFRPYNVTRIEIERGDQKSAFEKIKGTGDKPQDKWRQTAPGTARDADSTKVEDMLSRISNLRALTFADKAPSDATSVATVTAHYADGKKQERVTFVKSGSDAYATKPGEPGAAKFSATDLDEAIKALDALK